ncbi:hypothetical protein [Vibrio cholerae]|uniref:hypothetical protein n=1 Tax=Vibrio cholerae TaxID=666 RepID=UPI0011D702A6|nr:hypothetical protein [Vibrio cholerae]TXZ19758.1 hypothetical protein FXE70_13830 [Vibrio cholerae]
MKNCFYKTNGFVGSSVLFWAIDGLGYVSNIDQAKIYTLEEMQREVNNGWLRDEQEFPLSADLVNAFSQWRVDCQYVKKTYPNFTDPNNEYVAYKKNTWDGNDLAFHTGFGHSFDYERAVVYPAEKIPYESIEDHFEYFFVPKYHTDEIARRTFQKQNINRRKMITAAGITGLRQKRVRKATGKFRFNCIVCGRIVWEHAHPDDFETITCSHACETDNSYQKRRLTSGY